MKFSNLHASKWTSGFRLGLSLSVLTVLSACSSVQGQGSAIASVTKYFAPEPTTPPNLKNLAPSDAVLALIQRVMKAATAGVMTNEDVALKTLGLTVVPSTKPGGIRQIITGIAVLDDDNEARVYYGVNRDPSRAYKWEFSISSLDRLVCVTKESADLVDSNFGTSAGMSFGLHDPKSFGGIYFYSIYGDQEKTSTSFTYWRRDGGKRCLRELLVRQTTR